MLNDEASLKTEAEKKADKEFDGLLVLLEKFNIDPVGKNCWLSLALCLARRHEINWPNVKATRGAPKGARTQAGGVTLAQLVYGIKKKKPGRPTVPKLKPEEIDQIKAEHGLSGHGSDKEAIRIFVGKYTTPATRQSEIKYVQKRLSEERKKIPKISK